MWESNLIPTNYPSSHQLFDFWSSLLFLIIGASNHNRAWRSIVFRPTPLNWYLSDMIGSKVNRSAGVKKVIVDASAVNNNLPLPMSWNVVDPRVIIYSHQNLARASQVPWSVPSNQAVTHVRRPAMQYETLICFHMLQTNLGVQGTNKLPNDKFNIFRQQKSNAIEERLQLLEESL